MADAAKSNPLLHPIGRLKTWWNHPRRERPKWTDVSIVLLTIGIVYLASAQLAEMRNSGKQTDRIIEADNRMASAMEGSLKQAQGAFDAANKQAELTQRAWIALAMHTRPQTTPQPSGPPADTLITGQPIDIQVGMKNTGRTPALNVKSVTVRQAVHAKSGKIAPPPFTYSPEQYVIGGNLTPDGDMYSDTVSMFTPLDKERISSMKVRVFVHGRVEYDDVFGIHHWRNFCGFLLPTGALGICPYHNDMDTDTNEATAKQDVLNISTSGNQGRNQADGKKEEPTDMALWLNDLILLITAVLVARYVIATDGLLRSSQEQIRLAQAQVEGLSLPAIVVQEIGSEGMNFLNIGNGPALSLEWRLKNKETSPIFSETNEPVGALSYLEARQTASLSINQNAIVTRELHCLYRSLSGKKYVSVSSFTDKAIFETRFHSEV